MSCPFKDFEPALSTSSQSESSSPHQRAESKTPPTSKNDIDSKTKIDEFFWLKSDLTIVEWLNTIEKMVDKNVNAIDYWK